MKSFQENMSEYKRQLEKGAVQAAYKGLMEYIMHLRMDFKRKYPDYSISNNIYYGYMDMTYFSIVPESLKTHGLKIALVFIHETCRFEVWLAAVNKQVQYKYWKLFSDNDWNKYQLVPSTQGYDSIIELILVDDPNFSDLDSLKYQIENKTMIFIEDIEDFLSKI